MNHLVRAGLLLAGVLLFLFVGVRLMPIPAAITSLGFHPREVEENTKAWAALPVQYAQTSTCTACHIGNYTLWKQGGHKTVSCENCHGPAKPHLDGGKKPVVDGSRELCSTCHARLVSRPSRFPQVDASKHGGVAECRTCHNPHEPRAGMPPKVPHATEDRVSCQACHNPHEPLQVLPPRVPHTVEGRSDCLSCHGSPDQRGSTQPRVPHTLEGRTNCLLCHNASGLRPFPSDHVGRTAATCLNCHRSTE